MNRCTSCAWAGRGVASGANRPDRLVGDDDPLEVGVGHVGDGRVELGLNAAERLAGVALGQCLADADDRATDRRAARPGPSG